MTLELVTNLPKDENDLLAFGLDELAKLGARRILNQALQLKVEEYINQFKDLRDDQGKRLVVRNGKSKARKVTTGCGTFSVEAPRVNDKREGEKFTSKLLPPYLRRSQNVESILPILYLKGLSGNVFVDALGDDKRACLLVVIGVTKKGEKKLLAVEGGYCESKESWKHIFSDLESGGLKSPLMVIGDGGLGLWAATREIEKLLSGALYKDGVLVESSANREGVA